MSENNGELIFSEQDLEPIQVKVTYGSKKYILREASEDAAIKYRDQGLRGARMVDGKVVGVDNIAGVQSLLVALCLCETNPDGSVKTHRIGNDEFPVTVPLSTVKKMHQRVVRKLFEKAKEISNLRETEDTVDGLRKRISEDQKKLGELLKEEEVLKNVPSSTDESSE